MSLLYQTPTKQVDIGFLVFIQRYATDLLKWDILTFFAHHPDFCGSLPQIAQHLKRVPHSLQPEIGDLVLLGILVQTRHPDAPTLYQLTSDPHLRQMTLKFAA